MQNDVRQVKIEVWTQNGLCVCVGGRHVSQFLGILQARCASKTQKCVSACSCSKAYVPRHVCFSNKLNNKKL